MSHLSTATRHFTDLPWGKTIFPVAHLRYRQVSSTVDCSAQSRTHRISQQTGMTETAITRNNLLDSLRRMAPGFQINPDLKEDSLGYPIVNDLARYICDQAGLDEFDKVRNGLEFLEVGLKLGDSYKHDLVHESLETLFSCERINVIKSQFGPFKSAPQPGRER
jgi:hypothetical protein